LFRSRIRSREYRSEWTWLAEREPGGPPLAVAIWWGRPPESVPAALDGVFVADTVGPAADRSALAAGLLDAAQRVYAAAGVARPLEYHIFLPGDWRDRPDAIAALGWRREAARLAGLTQTLERLCYEWRPVTGLPAPCGQLKFRAEPDDEIFVDLFHRVLAGTLDATSRQEAATLGATAQARADVAFYRDKMTGNRAWWRVAQAPDGEVVGFGVPSANTESAVVGYLGVLPEHRGHGYADEILAEITRVLAGQASPAVIRADTDLANAPMAAAFERVGYRNVSRRLVLSAP
jgi:GNAT superfamily N-acetyltransferase